VEVAEVHRSPPRGLNADVRSDRERLRSAAHTAACRVRACRCVSIAATFVDVTEADAPPRIGWLHVANGGFEPPASWHPGLAAEEAKRRARDLLYASDPVIEHFYEHALPVPEPWAEYRFALHQIMFFGRLTASSRLEQPKLPTFSFKRDAVHAAQRLPAYLPPETRRLLERGRARGRSEPAV
jgi:hypothetical protein